MKNPHFLLFGVFFCLFLCSSCSNSKPERPDNILSQDRIDAANQSAEVATQNVIVGDNAGLPHYYCPNKCEGSGGDESGFCPKCGETYAHNDAFHNTGGTSAPATQNSTAPIIGNNITTGGSNVLTTQTTTPKPAEPAQNEKGVWHYTCSNGCAGGGGAQGPCPGCGGDLAHNSEYHN